MFWELCSPSKFRQPTDANVYNHCFAIEEQPLMCLAVFCFHAVFYFNTHSKHWGPITTSLPKDSPEAKPRQVDFLCFVRREIIQHTGQGGVDLQTQRPHKSQRELKKFVVSMGRIADTASEADVAKIIKTNLSSLGEAYKPGDPKKWQRLVIRNKITPNYLALLFLFAPPRLSMSQGRAPSFATK